MSGRTWEKIGKRMQKQDLAVSGPVLSVRPAGAHSKGASGATYFRHPKGSLLY